MTRENYIGFCVMFDLGADFITQRRGLAGYAEHMRECIAADAGRRWDEAAAFYRARLVEFRRAPDRHTYVDARERATDLLASSGLPDAAFLAEVMEASVRRPLALLQEGGPILQGAAIAAVVGVGLWSGWLGRLLAVAAVAIDSVIQQS